MSLLKKIRISAYVLLISILGNSINAEATDVPKEVRIATVAYNTNGKIGFNGSSAIIEKQGWLKAELDKLNVKLTWVPVTQQSVGVTINESFANHSVDFAAYGDLPSIILNAGGVETKLIVPGGRGNNVYLVVPPNSNAKSILDLKGKRIALHRGRPWEITFARLVESKGLKLSDFKIVNLNPGAGIAALTAGNVDALVTLSDAYDLEDKKIGKIVWSTKKPGEDWKMRAEVWGSKDFVTKYPVVTQLVATAYVKAAYWSSNDANFNEYLKVANQNGQPEDIFRREFSNDVVSWKNHWTPLFDDLVLDHYKNGIKYAQKIGLIRQEIDASKLFDKKFVEAAIKELKIENYWQPETPSSGSF